jgi:hypothetical protein
MPLTQVYGGLEEDPRNEPGVVGFLSLSCIRVFTLLEEDAIVVEHLEHGPDQSGSVRSGQEGGWPGHSGGWGCGRQSAPIATQSIRTICL